MVIEAAARPRRLLAVLLALAAPAHLLLVFRQNVNWDEFYFLSFVYDARRGSLTNALQTFHVQLFGWLTRIGGTEVDQVVAGRAVYLLLLAGTCGCVYLLARRAASVEGAFAAVLGCAAYSNILQHGTSFRSDGLSVFLLMAALVLLGCRTAARSAALAAAAVLVAVAGLVTIKSVFFLPTVALGIVGGGGPRSIGRRAGEVLLFAAMAAGVALSLYAWHRGTIAPAGGATAAAAYLETSASKVVGAGAFPRRRDLEETVRGNLVQWGLLFCGIGALGRRIAARRGAAEAAALLALALPVLSVLVYRNAFPYYYVFVMPPALVLCAVGYDAATAAAGGRLGLRGTSWSLAIPDYRSAELPAVLVLALGTGLLVYTWRQSADAVTPQRQVLAAVHRMFPEPVSYIDRNGMVASFRKVGPFMSTWGMESYRGAGRPVFAEILRAHQPRFLLANSPDLAVLFAAGRRVPKGRLLPSDADVLQSSFLPYWGPVHVAGRRLQLQQDCDQSWDVALPGAYRLESAAPVTIEGHPYPPGAVVELPTGAVTFRSSVTQEIVLRTAEASPPPDVPPPAAQLYLAFPPAGPRPLALP